MHNTTRKEKEGRKQKVTQKEGGGRKSGALSVRDKQRKKGEEETDGERERVCEKKQPG